MGTCVSVHRNSDSAMKLGLAIGSKDDKLVIPPSPIKENPTNWDRPIDTTTTTTIINNNNTNNNVVAVKSQWSPRPATSFGGYGSKEDTFFDSQAWLESDCEDDFYSVNGDFTPSRGNTPVHHNFPMGTPRVNKASFNKASFEDRIPASLPKSSPTDKKKKLAELFRQDQDVDELNSSGNQNMSNGDTEVKTTVLGLPPKSAYDTPYGTNSVCSSERTANGDILTEKVKPIKSMQCCLPSLISCRSFSERKKKMSPAIAVNDEP